jgi:ArsR family transcriptional regulator
LEELVVDSRENYTCQVKALHEDAVDVALTQVLADDEVRQLAGLFKVLGDPTRTRILRALTPGELCVCDISHVLGMSMSSVSHQLRVLREHNLVTPRRDGKIVFYSLADTHVQALHETALEHVRE